MLLSNIVYVHEYNYRYNTCKKIINLSLLFLVAANFSRMQVKAGDINRMNNYRLIYHQKVLAAIIPA